MPKKPEEIKAFEAMVPELVFYPTEDQRQAKSAFWAVYTDMGVAAHEVTLAAVLSITNDSRVGKWWKDPMFQDWFLNKEEYKQRLDYLMHIGLDALEKVLRTSRSDTAIVSAMKLIIAANNKMPSNSRVIYADAFVNDLGEKELDEYLRKNIHLIQGAQHDNQEEDEA